MLAAIPRVREAIPGPSPGARPVPKPDDDESIHIRPMDNGGYVMRRSGMDGKGNYTSRETYHETRPEVHTEGKAKSKPLPAKAKSSLQRATAHLRRNKL